MNFSIIISVHKNILKEVLSKCVDGNLISYFMNYLRAYTND